MSKTFAGFRAVDNCSFQIEAGKITGLIGPNGAGKTTLFNMVAGVLKPSQGHIVLDGRNVTGMAPHQLFRLGLVRTFQIPREFGRMTVLENLMVVPPCQLGENLWMSWFRWQRVLRQERQIRHKAEEVLGWVNLLHVRDELAQNLSGGQKKLLELGRTLMIEPKVILLDEPGAGVNRTLLRQLTDIIVRLNQEWGCTICLIDHDLELVDHLCHHVVVMAQGTVMAAGTMAEMRQNPQVQDAYLGNVHPARTLSS
ncbi:ABC transporter protein [Halomicronema hongdechloris C2206]|uniref:ABC transporter protein n=1 Tax=Halomicronema hongdechloris C2206 TaxID=1641165 RepID=A0A1Z3HPB2_9CYAN|nr:ABC transporter ATP-binding protein [Halomicronema hongdechloris]ASC72138.1 ABC transporter protein [Halomicronema hongdechloris C2206]